MAAMTTVLTEFSDQENSRVWTEAGHSASKQKKTLQRRKVPTGNQTVLEDQVMVLHTAEDSGGEILPSNISFAVTIRRPMSATTAGVNAALATFRDIIAGDEFGDVVSEQKYLT